MARVITIGSGASEEEPPVTVTDDLELHEPDCWISLRAAEPNRCAVTIAGSITSDAARLVRRWVVLLRDAVCGDVTIHCEGLTHVDGDGVVLFRELIWGLEAQGRHVRLEALAEHLEPMLRPLVD
jgi:ABC-type transporter Mla MlaB component